MSIVPKMPVASRLLKDPDMVAGHVLGLEIVKFIGEPEIAVFAVTVNELAPTLTTKVGTPEIVKLADVRFSVVVAALTVMVPEPAESTFALAPLVPKLEQVSPPAPGDTVPCDNVKDADVKPSGVTVMPAVFTLMPLPLALPLSVQVALTLIAPVLVHEKLVAALVSIPEVSMVHAEVPAIIVGPLVRVTENPAMLAVAILVTVSVTPAPAELLSMIARSVEPGAATVVVPPDVSDQFVAAVPHVPEPPNQYLSATYASCATAMTSHFGTGLPLVPEPIALYLQPTYVVLLATVVVGSTVPMIR